MRPPCSHSSNIAAWGFERPQGSARQSSSSEPQIETPVSPAFPRVTLCSLSLPLLQGLSSSGCRRLPHSAGPKLGRGSRDSAGGICPRSPGLEGLESGSYPSLWKEGGEALRLESLGFSLEEPVAPG